MQVTGRDGQMITYNKNRAINAAAVRSYIFKGGTGRLLEFTYDTNCQYSDDQNAFRNFALDPKTGAITQKDFLNDKKKQEYIDAKTPTALHQLKFDDETNFQVKDIILNNPEKLPYLAQTTPFKTYTGIDDATGNVTLVAYDQVEALSYSSMDIGVGQYREVLPALDNTAHIKPVVSCPTPYINEQKEVIENEIKNLRRGEQEQVKAHATVLGDPQITSGVNVMMAGLAKRRNGKYFLTGCIHDITPSGGYLTKFEMYAVGDISIGVNTNETTVTKTDITKKAKDIKTKKNEAHPTWAEIQKRGYFLKTDYVHDAWEEEADKVDREWNIKMPGTFYQLTFTRKDGTQRVYRIKIPIHTNGKTQQPIEAFGYEALYDMLGCHDELWVRTHINMGHIDEIKEDTDYNPVTEPSYKNMEHEPDPAPTPWQR
jgi:hypothetical protein